MLKNVITVVFYDVWKLFKHFYLSSLKAQCIVSGSHTCFTRLKFLQYSMLKVKKYHVTVWCCWLEGFYRRPAGVTTSTAKPQLRKSEESPHLLYLTTRQNIFTTQGTPSTDTLGKIGEKLDVINMQCVMLEDIFLFV